MAASAVLRKRPRPKEPLVGGRVTHESVIRACCAPCTSGAPVSCARSQDAALPSPGASATKRHQRYGWSRHSCWCGQHATRLERVSRPQPNWSSRGLPPRPGAQSGMSLDQLLTTCGQATDRYDGPGAVRECIDHTRTPASTCVDVDERGQYGGHPRHGAHLPFGHAVLRCATRACARALWCGGWSPSTVAPSAPFHAVPHACARMAHVHAQPTLIGVWVRVTSTRCLQEHTAHCI